MADPNIDNYSEGLKNLPDALARMGFTQLRDVQVKPVHRVMQGYDLLCFLPTAAGKSAIFAIPAMAMKWRTLVLSPLISLIRDQSEKLTKVQGLRIGALSSEQSSGENAYAIADWKEGNIDVLFAAPERLDSHKFLSALKETPPDMVVVDEAHVMSQWGANFRPSYVTCGEVVKALNPRVILALTATCTTEIEGDIRRILGLDNAGKYAHFYNRRNLVLTSMDYAGDVEVVRRAASNPNGQSIIYCATVRLVDDMFALYGNSIPGGAVKYHGQMDDVTRSAFFERFMNGGAKVVFATNAFGLGVDRETVTAVIHRDTPKNLEAYYQEAGRAGRGGQQSDCCLFVDEKSIATQEYFLKLENPHPDYVRGLYNIIASRGGSSKGGCDVMISELGKLAGLAPRQESTALTLLMSEGIVERDTSVDLWHKVKMLKADTSDLTPLKKKVFDSLVTHTWVDKQTGYLCFKLEDLAAALNTKPMLLRGHINDLYKAGYIDYKPAPRSAPIRILKSISAFDFDRLKERQRQAYNKFDSMLRYIKTPDANKHEFIEEYFSKVYVSDI